MRTGSSSIVWSIECSERSMTALTLSTCRGRRAAGRIRLRKRVLREWLCGDWADRELESSL